MNKGTRGRRQKREKRLAYARQRKAGGGRTHVWEIV